MTGFFSSNPASSTNKKQDDSKANAGAAFIVATLVFLFIGKQSPMIALGCGFGWFPYVAVKYGQTGAGKLRGYIFDLLFFTLFTFVMVGLPHRLKGEGYPGLVAFIPGFGDFAWACARKWNSLIPDFGPFAKNFLNSLRVFKFSYNDIASYVWFAPISAFFSSIFYLFISVFRGNTKIETGYQGDKNDQKFWIGTLPAKGFNFIWFILVWGWVRLGYRGGLKNKGASFLKNAILLGLYCLIEYIRKNHPVEVLIPYPDLYKIAHAWVSVPFFAVITGFIASKYLPNNFRQMFGLATFDESKIKLDAQSSQNKNGFYLGRAFSGKHYTLSEENLAYHVEVVAPTGSGKTNLLKNLISDRIHRGHGIIFLDLKADFQVVSWMMRASIHAGREGELRLVSLANRELSVPYNPIKYGTAPEIQSQLMNSMTWSEEFYRNVSGIALMTLLRGLCEYRDKTKEFFHLGHLYELLNEPGQLRKFSSRLAGLKCTVTSDMEALASQLDRPSERNKFTGLIANLGLLIHSAAGPLISEDVKQGSFDFKEAVDFGEISYVLMNSMKLRETAQVFGKIILQDLMRLAGDRYAELDGNKRHKPVTLVIDEFAAFAIPEFIDFMDRARGAGIGIVFAHQSRADLRAISPEFQHRIEANANTVIVSGLKSSEDAEYFAGLIGTRTVKKETIQVDDSAFFGPSATGMKSIRETEEYIIHPNQLKNLSQGEVFTVSATKDKRYGMVKVPEAFDFLDVNLDQTKLLTMLASTRNHYMTESSHQQYLDLKKDEMSLGLTKAKIDGEVDSDNNSKPKASSSDLWS